MPTEKPVSVEPESAQQAPGTANGVYLSFDYGERRIGLACGNTETGSVMPLAFVSNKSGTPDWQRIQHHVEQWDPVGFIVGDPLTAEGELQQMTHQARGFARRLAKRFKRPFFLVDERYSSIEAAEQLKYRRQKGLQGKTQRPDTDKLSAAIVLQRWLMTEIKSEEVESWLVKLETDLRQLIDADSHNYVMIGIRTGGVAIANKLQQAIDPQMPLGQLNISFYRDDFSRIGVHPVVEPSELPFDIEDSTVILVDDVLNSGRTIRAAMNELFDFGRPARIILAVLIDREGRQLPIQADVRGHALELGPGQHIKLDTEHMICSISQISSND